MLDRFANLVFLLHGMKLNIRTHRCREFKAVIPNHFSGEESAVPTL